MLSNAEIEEALKGLKSLNWSRGSWCRATLERNAAALAREVLRHRKAAREISLRAMARQDAWLMAGGNGEGLGGQVAGLHEAAEIAAKAMEGKDD